MSFEKVNNINTVAPANWTNCANCGYRDDNPPSNEYSDRSSQTATELNAANNGKSCVSG